MSWLLMLLSLYCTDPATSPSRNNGSSRKTTAAKTAETKWLTGTKLDSALEQPVIATWQNGELRTVLKTLSEQRHVAIILDRRLDPHFSVTLDTSGDPLRSVLSKLADGVGGLLSVTGEAVYIGPTNSAAKLRTILALRQEELQQLPGSRKSSLNAERPLQWEDLESPAEIVQRVIHDRDAKLTLKNEAQIPYDLWAGGETPPVGFAAALTLVLIQFDLTYRFDSAGTAVEIIPIPAKVAIERRFSIPKAKASEISKVVRIEVPRLETTATPEQLIATGTQEQLEALERIIRSVSGGSGTTKKSAAPVPISKRRISFQAKGVPLNSILEKLATTGIRFEYDRDQLEQDGVKIEQLVDIDVKDVSLTEMFEKLFGPAGIKFQIDGLTIKLSAVAR